MHQLSPATTDTSPAAPHPFLAAERAPGAPTPQLTAERVPGTPHPLALQGRDPERAKRQSLLFSVLALVTLPVPPLPFVFGAWAIDRAGHVGTTKRPVLGHVLGIVALVLAAMTWLIVAYLIPAFIRFMFTLDASFNVWLWWQ
jgi:hypothetical protein